MIRLRMGGGSKKGVCWCQIIRCCLELRLWTGDSNVVYHRQFPVQLGNVCKTVINTFRTHCFWLAHLHQHCIGLRCRFAQFGVKRGVYTELHCIWHDVHHWLLSIGPRGQLRFNLMVSTTAGASSHTSQCAGARARFYLKLLLNYQTIHLIVYTQLVSKCKLDLLTHNKTKS